MVRVTAIDAVPTTTTSPPTGTPLAMVCTLTVASPGSGLVTKRDTYTPAPSPDTATWRGFGPTDTLPSVVPLAASSLSSMPVPSSATSAALAERAIATP